MDAFLIFIRMRDTPAGSPVPETRSPERKASPPPPLLPLHIIPTTYSKNVNYPGKYFNFSSKGGGQRLAGSNLEELEAKFYPISLHGEREDKEGKGEVRRPFDTRIHPSVDVYPNVILIAHIMHSTRTRRRGEGERKRGQISLRSAVEIGEISRRSASLAGGQVRWKTWGIGARAMERGSHRYRANFFPRNFQNPGRARARERESARRPRDRVNFPTSHRESNITE